MKLTEQEKAAAERVRRVHNGESLSVVYSHVKPAMIDPERERSFREYAFQSDCTTLADLALRLLDERAGDDETPVDEAWLRSVGFGDCEIYEPCLSLGIPSCDDGTWIPVVIGWPDGSFGIWSLNVDNCEYEPTGIRLQHIKTRGDVRRLCAAIGIELKEPVNDPQ